MEIFRFNVLVIIILSFTSTTAQELSPPIHNYSSFSYKAASQNWDIALDESGVIYVANNQGLLSFDGQRWELFDLENRAVIRSVLPHKGKIYTGSYREFGYWERDTRGDMCYTSLIPLLGEYELQSEEFWEIIAHKDAIYFRSFGAVYRYENDKITPVQRVNVNQMEIYKDRLVVATGDSGLFYLNSSGEMEPLPNQEVLKDGVVRELIVHGDELLIGLKDDIFLFDGENIRRLVDKGLQEELQQYELNHVLSLSSGEILIGTLKYGIIQFNEGTGEIFSYNRWDGLQNNTVLAMAQNKGKIWLGLDNGIDVVDIYSPFRFFTDESGELGSVYDLNFKGDDLYLASNTGVFRMNDEKIELLEGAEGHSWNLEVHDGVMYSNHNNGTFKIVNDRFVPIDRRTGSFQILKNGNKRFFIGSYTGIDLFNENTEEVQRLKGIDFPVKQMLLENNSTLWVTDSYEGIYRVGLNSEGDSITSVKKISASTGVGKQEAELYRVNGQIVAFTSGEWYHYNPFTQNLELLSEWQEYEGKRLLGQDGKYFWFMDSEKNLLTVTNFKDDKILVTAGMLNKRTVKKNERLIKLNDSIYYITLHDGFAKLNLNELKDFSSREFLSTPVVQKLYDGTNYYDLNIIPHIPSKQAREVTILTGLPVSDAVGMEYELVGNNTAAVRGEVQEGKIQFQNLPYDQYELRLTAVGSQQKASVFSAFRFVVDPPWYLKDYMKVLYLLSLLMLVVLIYYINKLKLQQHRKILKVRYQKEHEERMNKLEKEQLINEINMKRKELANSTVIAAKKNEVLMQIQGELNKDKAKFSNQYRLKHIMNKINNAVQNDDEWKVFETNFNELHEDFFRDLLSKFPNLSNRDLKLCAYLKMNLTSKEIAPLMGISVRGVEVHRYRLRKKINVDTSENLTNWLIANFK
ncbi:LuxR C-terminal-related transcriptional regulator [Salinimicrobium sp. TIG7-5_MAKvit]|uniref:helix-turn-helix and ligand-binding sensor domain-containing protein n=1 Tax=Salinimicrobium sp. TIG7-5_MAKvit TaxID=3121289 RepID=UPI003C6DC00B